MNFIIFGGKRNLSVSKQMTYQLVNLRMNLVCKHPNSTHIPQMFSFARIVSQNAKCKMKFLIRVRYLARLKSNY